MKRQEFVARSVLFLIVIALPLGILGYQYVLQPALNTQNIIDIQAYAPESGGFSPAIIHVNVGEEVTLRFTSMDVTHGIAIGPGLGIDLDHIDPGKHAEMTYIFDHPGTYTYYCTTWCSPDHWRMRGIIEVRDPSHPDVIPTAQPDPVIERLIEEGVNIDAIHLNNKTHDDEAADATELPSADRGAQRADSLLIPDELNDETWRRTHTPLEALTILQSANPDVSESDLSDVIAYLWLKNSKYNNEMVRTFNQNCAACHGEAGNGDGPAALLTAVQPVAFADLTYMLSMRSDVLYAKIRRGGMGTDMPNFGTLFTREETWLLVDYLWSLAFEANVNE